MRLNVSKVSIAFLMCLVPTLGHAQIAQQSFGGTQAMQHAGRTVLGAGRLLPASVEPATQVVVGKSGAWVLSNRLCLRSLAAPANSSGAFGTAAALVPSYFSVFSDVLAIGDPGANGGAGAVAIYFGGAILDSVPSLVLHGLAPGDLFGAAVAAIGDVNGDGFGDIAVGAPGRSSGTGAAYVFLGGTSHMLSPGILIGGAVAGDLFGTSLAATGDMNGDRLGDYVVGAPGALGGAGSVTLVRSGGAPLVVTASPLTAATYGERMRFAATVASADLTGDGLSDLVVGAPGASRGRGAVLVFPGIAGTFGALGWTLSGADAVDHFGSSVALAPLRTTSIVDLGVGSPGASDGHGSAKLFWGGAGFDATVDLVMTGAQPDDNFGSSLGAAAIFASAPAKQLLIGTPFSDLGAANSGSASFYALPPATAVEQTRIAIEADGLALNPEQFTTADPLLVIHLVGAAGVDLTTSVVTVDGVAMQLVGVPAKASDASASAGVSVQPKGLADGKHVLVAQLQSSDHFFGGAIQLEFSSAAHLRFADVHVTPNPVRGTSSLAFDLTRPAAYEFALYDLAGRRASEVQRAVGVSGRNEIRLGRSTNTGEIRPGVYFYVLSANYRGQRADTRGRVVFLR